MKLQVGVVRTEMLLFLLMEPQPSTKAPQELGHSIDAKSHEKTIKEHRATRA